MASDPAGPWTEERGRALHGQPPYAASGAANVFALRRVAGLLQAGGRLFESGTAHSGPACKRGGSLAQQAEVIAHGRRIAEIVFDPMRYANEALRLEREHGVLLVEWPQSESRMTSASESLHRLIVEGGPQHPGDRELDRHVAAAIAKPTPRGWRLVKTADSAQIDGVIALAMAAARASAPAKPIRVLGWL